MGGVVFGLSSPRKASFLFFKYFIYPEKVQLGLGPVFVDSQLTILQSCLYHYMPVGKITRNHKKNKKKDLG